MLATTMSKIKSPTYEPLFRGVVCESPAVSVVIPTFNHAHFLSHAISSVLAQTRPAREIIVVDDGSTDDPSEVAARFPGVRLIRQANQGRSAARNRGLRDCTSSHVLFLDADDRLLPNALAAGLICAAEYPDCAMIYGAHRDILRNDSILGAAHYFPISGNPYLALLRRNLIRMQATVLFERNKLIKAGGFDETLDCAEDYDLYLRLARSHPVASHSAIVAEYRQHGQNTSEDSIKMLRATLVVLNRHGARADLNAPERMALEDGRKIWCNYYAWTMIEKAYLNWPSRYSVRLLWQAMKTSPGCCLHTLKAYIWRRMKWEIATPIVQ
jgi:glycosyltransferase involved in cell wall biosynthesis